MRRILVVMFPEMDDQISLITTFAHDEQIKILLDNMSVAYVIDLANGTQMWFNREENKVTSAPYAQPTDINDILKDLEDIEERLG